MMMMLAEMFVFYVLILNLISLIFDHQNEGEYRKTKTRFKKFIIYYTVVRDHFFQNILWPIRILLYSKPASWSRDQFFNFQFGPF